MCDNNLPGNGREAVIGNVVPVSIESIVYKTTNSIPQFCHLFSPKFAFKKMMKLVSLCYTLLSNFTCPSFPPL